MIGKRLPEGITKGLPLFHWLLSTSYTSTELSISITGASPPQTKIFRLRIATTGNLRPCLMEESRRTWIFFSTLGNPIKRQTCG